jgi:hypothetical protein
MKRKIFGIFIVILLSISAFIPNISAMKKENVEIDNNDETFMEPTFSFLIGRIEDKQEYTSSWECFAKWILIIEIFSPKVHWLTYDEVSLEKPGLGIFTNRFIFGFYPIYL